jgi:hypothetical protein
MRKSNMSSSALAFNAQTGLDLLRYDNRTLAQMKLTLVLDPASGGVRARLIEEWEEIHGTARMGPMIRLFDTEEQATHWARAHASRRGLKQIYLTDNRKPLQEVPAAQRGGGTAPPG